jgi:hypothetical protein
MQRGRGMTFLGISVLVACVAAFGEGRTHLGFEGLILGIAIVAGSEWGLWNRRSR